MKKNRKKKFFNIQFLTSTVSTTLMLLLLGFVLFFSLIAQGLSKYVQENITFSIYLNNQTTSQEINHIKNKLSKERFIKEFTYITKEEALKEETEALGTNPKLFLGYNPFSPSFEIKLKSEYTHPDSIAKIEPLLSSNSNIEELVYQKDLINIVNENIKRINLFLLSLVVILLFISFTLIQNTIQLNVYSKRYLIHTMKLVGAKWSFIRKPFISKNLWISIFAGTIANSILICLLYICIKYEPELATFIKIESVAIVCSVIYIIGIIIIWLCSYISINKFLRIKSNKLYYI